MISDNEDDVVLSHSTLNALKDFAIMNGIVFKNDENICKDIRNAIDGYIKNEEIFQFVFQDKNNPEKEKIIINLEGLRRDIGQTLDSTGLTLWRAGDVLSDYLYKNNTILQGKHVIELGSGLGLCGILASYYCKDILITDGDEKTLHLLEKNCKLNNIQLDKENNNVLCKQLIWGHEIDNNMKNKFDIILGADIIYEEHTVDSLFKTVAELLAYKNIETNVKPMFILAFTKRNVFIDYILNIATKLSLKWQHISEDKENIEGIYHFFR